MTGHPIRAAAPFWILIGKDTSVIALGFLIVLLAAFLGLSGIWLTTSNSTQLLLEAGPLSYELAPVTLFIAGLITMALLWLGWAMIRSGTKRSVRHRRERKQLERDQREQDRRLADARGRAADDRGRDAHRDDAHHRDDRYGSSHPDDGTGNRYDDRR